MRVTYNPEYYLIKHLSAYIQQGAYMLKTNAADNHPAFVNPDGKIVLVIVNKENTAKNATIDWNDKTIKLNLKEKSFNTIRF